MRQVLELWKILKKVNVKLCFQGYRIGRKTFIFDPFLGVSLIFESFYLHSKIVSKPRFEYVCRFFVEIKLILNAACRN